MDSVERGFWCTGRRERIGERRERDKERERKRKDCGKKLTSP